LTGAARRHNIIVSAFRLLTFGGLAIEADGDSAAPQLRSSRLAQELQSIHAL